MSSLEEIIKKSSDCYYNSGELYTLTDEDYKIVESLGISLNQREVTDNVFDILNNEYQKLISMSDQKINIGAPISDQDTRKVKLPIPLPSINECKEGEVLPFLDKFVDTKISDLVIVMEKLDGCSCLLEYRDNKLERAYTRGDGVYGQDITDLAQNIYNIPNSVATTDILACSHFFVRGELIFIKQEIPHILKAMEHQDGKPRKNGRNAIAGQLNAKKINSAFLENVKFVPYQFIEVDSNNNLLCKKYKELELQWLDRLFYRVCNYHVVNKDELTDERLMAEVDYFKTNSYYECDGIVIVPDYQTMEIYEPTSVSNSNPQGVCKYKLNSLGLNETTSTVVDVEWAISKGGLLKPRVKIEPVELMDTVITYVTGNNLKFIKDNKIGIGAIVKIKRAGDVIPNIVEIIEPAKEPKLPEEYEITEGGVDARMVDTESSLKERAIKQFLFSCMYYKLDQAGEANVRTLYNEGIKSLPELISYSRHFDLAKFLGANGKKLQTSVIKTFDEEGTTVVDFCAAVNAFGPNIGSRLLERIYDKYETLEVTEEQLLEIPGFSYTNTTKYMNFLPQARNFIAEYEELGIKTKQKYLTMNNSSVAAIFTGIRSKELEKAIEASGGKIVTTVKRANLVIAKDPNGTSSKLTEARSRGIKIIQIDEAKKFFGVA